jgi:peptide-methionine (S)-S-oxide reductase
MRTIIAILLLSFSCFAAEQKAVFAGGCFWGVEAVFEHVKGVIDVRSGYSGGTAKTANYKDVSDHRSTHAEAVEIRFDPAKISYEQLLNIFFIVAHDPTELNRQGPDTGPQYRSAIFYADEAQLNAAKAFISALEKAEVYKKPIVTKLEKLSVFYPAEYDHQNYVRHNPDDPYVVRNDLPKLVALKQAFPSMLK